MTITNTKGQLISEWIFGVFKSPKNLIGFLGDLRTPKIHSEINWVLTFNENYHHHFLYIGDKASASNVAFLKRYGITHVLNAAEGIEEGLVDLNPDHYAGTGISYMGFPLWDAPGNLPYTTLWTKIDNFIWKL